MSEDHPRPEAPQPQQAGSSNAQPHQSAPHPGHQAHGHQAHPHYSAAKFPPAELIATLEDGTKVKRRVLRMRACDEKDEKGEICSGHLKRYFNYPLQVKVRFGDEIYRCERCHTIYLPNPQEIPRSGTLAW
jgi:hypothetical protein